MGPRFPHTLTLVRPTLGSDGDWTFPAGSTVLGALFRRRTRPTVPGVGEVGIVTAQAFLPSGTDIRLNDRLVRGADRFVVVAKTDGEDDKGNQSHVGVDLREVTGEDG